MIDPSASALLDAIADTLTNQVIPATSGGAQHSARVAASLCRIIAREINTPDDPNVVEQLGELLSLPPDAEPAAVWKALDEALKDADPDLTSSALPLVRAVVERELSISKPSYVIDHS